MKKHLSWSLASLAIPALLAVPASVQVAAPSRVAPPAAQVLSDATPPVTPAPVAPPAPTTLRAMVLGDSLAQGIGSSTGRGFRPGLETRLAAAGINVEWTNGGSAHDGWTVQDLRAGIDGWLAADHPDIVIMVIGTNNASGQKTGMANVEPAIHDLFNRITIVAPNVTLYVATIQYWSAPWSTNQVYINQYIIQSSWEHPGKVVLFSLDSIPVCGWLHPDGHPADAGYDADARQIYRAMSPQYTLPAIPADPWPTPVRRPGFERATVLTC